MAVSYLTEAEYFAADDVAELPLEYIDGEVFPIEDATNAHAFLGSRVSAIVGSQIQGSRWWGAWRPKVKIQVGRYLYPDAAVMCGDVRSNGGKFTETPKVVIEILSPTTEGYDRGTKFGYYRAIESLEQYVLVSQDAPHVDVFTRGDEGAWVLLPYDGLDAIARLDSVGVTMPLAELYSGLFE